MSNYTSNVDQTEVVRLIRASRRITLTTHAKPDGDAFGSVVALSTALGQLGHAVNAWLMPLLPAYLQGLRGFDRAKIFAEDSVLEDTDLLVIVDTGALSQIAPMREQLESHWAHTLVIDHHQMGDAPAQWRWIESDAAACCELVACLLDQMEVPINDPVIRDALYVGIASDTGWFRFPNTRPRTHELATRLLQAGVDQAALYAGLEQNHRPAKLALMSRALDSLQMLDHGRVAMMVLTGEDFAQSRADLGDTDRLVDLPQIVSEVQTVALIVEPPDNGEPIRLSLRSKSGPNSIDVAALAATFGGGGHIRAAGAKFEVSLDVVVRQVKDALCGNITCD